MAIRVARCIFCGEATWCPTCFTIPIATASPPVEFSFDVCGECFEPLPGYDPDNEALELDIFERLRAMAMVVIKSDPYLQTRYSPTTPCLVFEDVDKDTATLLPTLTGTAEDKTDRIEGDEI